MIIDRDCGRREGVGSWKGAGYADLAKTWNKENLMADLKRSGKFSIAGFLLGPLSLIIVKLFYEMSRTPRCHFQDKVTENSNRIWLSTRLIPG